MKTILIAVPTSEFIESDTFKSIYDLEIPEGYAVDFVPFVSDQIEHVRNQIATYVLENDFDYLFAVDSDIVFAPDTLSKLLAHNVDMVSGIYIQRIPNTHTIEIMRRNSHGGVTHVPYEQIKAQGLVPIDSCGFGCVLIKKQVIAAMSAPYFVYQSALNHAQTISEDVYFCVQAINRGFKIYADTSILCDHIGSWVFKVQNSPDTVVQEKIITDNHDQRLAELSEANLLPTTHYEYLQKMQEHMNVNPKVIYDIGACVLHWTKPAQSIWPHARFVVFEAMEECEFIYKKAGLDYNLGVLSNQDNRQVEFYQNLQHPGGNSYYRENQQLSPAAEHLYSDQHRVIKKTTTLDTVIQTRGFPLPDLIKIDVQGAELDILQGATNALNNCTDLILELQHVEYNKGAPLKDHVIEFLKNRGFELVTPLFCNNGVDGDYHFRKKS